MHVERTFTVPRPVETVFDYLSDFTTTNEWDPGTIETTRTSGAGGVGTTYANTSEFNGRKTDLVYETLVHERPARVQFQGRNKTVTTLDSMTLRAGRRRRGHRDHLPRRLPLRLPAQPGGAARPPRQAGRARRRDRRADREVRSLNRA